MEPDPIKQEPSTKRIIEAALFISGRSLSVEELARVCSSGSMGAIRLKIEELIEEYNQSNSGIQIEERGRNYKMIVSPDLEDKVINLAPEAELSDGALKTLALIAYKQPLKQSDLVKERGNRTYKYVQELEEKELINSEKEGRTKVLTTTSKFQDYFKMEKLPEKEEFSNL